MRDTLIVIGLALVAIVIGVFMFLYGQGTFSSTPPAAVSYTPPAVTVPFTQLAQGEHSTVSTRANYLITSKSELADLWAMVDARGQVPAVDFTTNSVIAVFAGKEPTAGYTIAVSKIQDASTREVIVTLSAPGGSCVLAQKATAPYQIIELPKTSLNLTHQDLLTTTSCLK